MGKLAAGVMAEFLGVFALMFIGGAAIIGGQELLGVALAHGLILSVMVSATMHISGAQFNPAVSLGLSVIGKQPWGRCGAFIAAQLAGGVAGAFVLKLVFSAGAVEAARLGATLGAYSTAEVAGELPSDLGRLIILEALTTFLLMIVILGSAVDPRGVGKEAKVGGFAIGLCVSALILAIGPYTGASMNPSRSFGPAVVGGYWDIHWAYWAAPIAGAVAAALLWKAVLQGRDRAGE